LGETPAFDGNGFETGEAIVVYTEPIKLRANVSPARGEAAIESFGVGLDFDKTILFQGMSPITETSILWVDSSVDNESPYVDGKRIPHDYIIRRIAESLPSTNHTVVAIKKTHVTHRAAMVVSSAGIKMYDGNGNENLIIQEPLMQSVRKLLHDIHDTPLVDKDGNYLMFGG